MRNPDFMRVARELLGLGAPTYDAWIALLSGALGCHLSDAQAGTFRALTQRDPLKEACRELWLAVGRRGGKSRAAAAMVVFLALLKEWRLAPGEVGTALVLANDREQARVAFRYVRGLLEAHPVLAREVTNITAHTITLANGIEIAIGTADNAAVRGRTIVAAILDEFAFWPYEQAVEVLRALRPGMATQPEAMLLVISTVYAAAGPFYEARRAHLGSDDPRVLYAVATSQQMNPTLSDEFIATELERDPTGNAAEYLSIERSDVAGFLDALLIDGNTRTEPRELPAVLFTPSGAHMSYVAGIDVSGGRNDAAACAIAHRNGQHVIVDACRRWPSPHDPARVASHVAEFLAPYRLTCAHADNYGAELARVLYAEAGLSLIAAEVTRGEAYLHLLPLLTTGRIELPPDPRLRTELLGLERRTGRGGRDSIDHRPGAHDDLANAIALAAWAASRGGAWTGEPRTYYERSTFLDGLYGPVAQERVHPGDLRPDDPIALHLSQL